MVNAGRGEIDFREWDVEVDARRIGLDTDASMLGWLVTNIAFPSTSVDREGGDTDLQSRLMGSGFRIWLLAAQAGFYGLGVVATNGAWIPSGRLHDCRNRTEVATRAWTVRAGCESCGYRARGYAWKVGWQENALNPPDGSVSSLQHSRNAGTTIRSRRNHSPRSASTSGGGVSRRSRSTYSQRSLTARERR